jgi:hypothetical protein
MGNIKIKAICACGEEVKDADLQADIHSVLAMLEGRVEHEKIANYIREYMLNTQHHVGT